MTPDHYRWLYDKLCEVRSEGAWEISVEEWWARIYDPESLDYILNFNMVENQVDTSDEKFEKLTPEAKLSFMDRERKRIRRGWWKKAPGFLSLSPAAQSELKKKFPYAGIVQVMPAANYFSQMYLKVQPDGSEFKSPTYFRRDHMMFQWMDILESYPLHGLEGRAQLHCHKKRGCHYTHSLIAGHIRRMIVQEEGGYLGGAALDVGVKFTTFAQEFRKLYYTVPIWMQPHFRTGSGKVKNGFSAPRGSDGAIDFWVYHPHPKTGLRNPQGNHFMLRTHDGTKWESPRPQRVDFDEAGITRYELRPVLQKIRGSLISGSGQETGFLTVGGTSDANNQHMSYLEDVRHNPEAHNAFIFFYGEQHISPLVNECGYVDPEPIIQKCERERIALENAGDQKSLIQVMVKRPIKLDDCFFSTTRQTLPIERMRKQEERCMEKQMSPDLDPDDRILTGWFRADQGDITKIVFTPASEYDKRAGRHLPIGGWRILGSEMRHSDRDKTSLVNKSRGILEPDHLYFAGCDNVASSRSEAELLTSGQNVASNLSKNAMVVIGTMSFKPVAYYFWRHNNPEDDFLQMLMGALYFNCYLFPESNLPWQIEWTRRYQTPQVRPGTFARYLYPTPIDVGGNWRPGKRMRISDMKVGMRTTTDKTKHFDHFMPRYWHEYTELVEFPELIEQHRKWDIDNKKGTPDLGMAMLITLIGLDNFLKLFKINEPAFVQEEVNKRAQMLAQAAAAFTGRPIPTKHPLKNPHYRHKQ